MADANADDDDRTTAQGLFVFADSYLASARSLKAAGLQYGHAESPIRFLLYHAAELYLKAFLRASELSLAEVRILNHKFEKLVAVSERNGLRLPQETQALLLLADRTKDVIETRYVRTGFRRVRPTLSTVGDAVSAIRKAVREHKSRQGKIVLAGENIGKVGAELEEPWDN